MPGRPRSARAHYHALGLTPGAPLAEVHRAYRRRRAVYDDSSLATYTLLTPDERRRELARLEAAYRAILAAVGRTGDATSRSAEPPQRSKAASAKAVDVDGASPGEVLRAAREACGFSLEDLAAETKIRPTLLAALEGERADALPAAVFVRGFVIQCGRALGLDEPEGLARRYLELLERGGNA